jgi:hypothetical protein
MRKLLLIKPNIISAKKEAELKKAGYIVIESEKPEEIKVYDEFGDLDRDTILSTALEALSWGNDSTCRNAFGNLLRGKILKKNK